MIEPRWDIQQIQSYRPPQEGRSRMIRLDFNENIEGCSPVVQKALQGISREIIGQYPEYEKIYQLVGRQFDLRTEEILLVNGIDEGLRLICEALLNRRERVLIPSPTFSMYKFYAKLKEAIIVEIPLLDDFSFPAQQVSTILHTYFKLVFICSPNNPTGKIVSVDYVEELAKENPATIFIIDEAYIDFGGTSSLALIRHLNNLIVLRTFSKAYGLAGSRIGMICSNVSLITTIQKIASPYGVNAIAIRLLQSALQDLNYVRSYVDQVNCSKRYLMEELQGLGFKSIYSEANFILVNFRKINQFIIRGLLANGILIRDRSSYIMLEGYSRISIGTQEQMELLVKTIRQLLNRPLLLFDMDGVLINVSQSYQKAIEKTVNFYGDIPVTSKKIVEFKKIPGYNNDWGITQALLLEEGINIDQKQIIDKFQEFYLGTDFNGFVSNEQCIIKKELLEELSGKYRLGIVTGRPRMEAEYTLQRFGILKIFDTIVTMEDVQNGKPDPEGILLAMKELCGRDGVYFGDTINDMIAANKAEIIPIAVGSVFDHDSEFRVIDSINELFSVLPGLSVEVTP